MCPRVSRNRIAVRSTDPDSENEEFMFQTNQSRRRSRSALVRHLAASGPYNFNQQWTVTSTGEGIWSIRPAHSSKSLDGAGSGDGHQSHRLPLLPEQRRRPGPLHDRNGTQVRAERDGGYLFSRTQGYYKSGGVKLR
jgi:hypothetical protein